MVFNKGVRVKAGHYVFIKPLSQIGVVKCAGTYGVQVNTNILTLFYPKDEVVFINDRELIVPIRGECGQIKSIRGIISDLSVFNKNSSAGAQKREFEEYAMRYPEKTAITTTLPEDSTIAVVESNKLVAKFNGNSIATIKGNVNEVNGDWTLNIEKSIKEVIFNDPATIVFWNDGSKTVVKCQEGDVYSEETGLAMCICKKIQGNKGSFNNVFKKYCGRQDVAVSSPDKNSQDRPFRVSLPSIDEVTMLTRKSAQANSWWWLRSPGVSDSFAANVGNDGYVYSNGYFVDYDYGSVRPMIKIPSNTADITKKGYSIFGEYNDKPIKWIIISDESNEWTLVSKDAICQHRFDKDSNDFDKSEIKKFLNEELVDQMFTEVEQEYLIDFN